MSSRAAFWCTVKWPVITKSTESSGFVLRRGKRNYQSNSRGCLPLCSVISSPRFNAKHRVTVVTARNDQLLENPQGCIKKPKQLFQVCHVLFVARSWGGLTSQHNLRWSVSLLVTSYSTVYSCTNGHGHAPRYFHPKGTSLSLACGVSIIYVIYCINFWKPTNICQ